jgi:uncharacterized protein YkwD
VRPIVPCRLRRLSLTLLAACAVAVAVPASAGAASPCDQGDLMPSQLTDSARQATTLCLVNRERTTRGLRSLRVDRRLTVAALAHSRDMVAKGYFAHDSRSGATFDARIARTGWMRGRSRWGVGENLAWGSLSRAPARAIVAAWMDSPLHRRNILQPEFRTIGIGVVDGAPVAGIANAATYTTDFGT